MTPQSVTLHWFWETNDVVRESHYRKMLISHNVHITCLYASMPLNEVRVLALVVMTKHKELKPNNFDHKQLFFCYFFNYPEKCFARRFSKVNRLGHRILHVQNKHIFLSITFQYYYLFHCNLCSLYADRWHETHLFISAHLCGLMWWQSLHLICFQRDLNVRFAISWEHWYCFAIGNFSHAFQRVSSIYQMAKKTLWTSEHEMERSVKENGQMQHRWQNFLA